MPAPRKPSATSPDEVKKIVTEPGGVTHRPSDAPKTPQDIAMEMAKAGVPEAVIIAALNSQFGGGDGQGGGGPRTAADGEQLGPDPRMVAAYQERMKHYVKPKTRFTFGGLHKDDPKLASLLEGIVDSMSAEDDPVAKLLEGLHDFGGVKLPRTFVEWCVQWQYWQTTLRKMPKGEVFTEAKTLEDMVRSHWFAHPQERARLQQAKNPNQVSGVRADFNPAAGTWG